MQIYSIQQQWDSSAGRLIQNRRELKAFYLSKCTMRINFVDEHLLA